jgi:DNA-binding CsgD family transcriptional regulator
MSAPRSSDLLDLVYDTALDPSLWVPLMARLADLSGGAGGWLSQLSTEDGSGCGEDDPMSRVDPSWPARYNAHYAQRNPLHPVGDSSEFKRRWTPCILTDEDLLAKDELVRTEFYNDFWRPQDIHAALMVRLATQGAQAVTLNISRPGSRGQFSRRDIEAVRRYQPHLIRAYQLGRRMAATRRLSADMASALDRSPHGLFVLTDDGEVLLVNRAGAALTAEEGGLRVSGGRLGAAVAADARRLQALIAAAGIPDGARRSGGSMALATPARRLPLSVTVAPISAERLGPFRSGPSVLVCVTDLEAGVSLPEHTLRDLFGLTRAETRLALALFEGLTPGEAAARFGVSPYTTRVHLRHVFEKTGTSRQSELARLMMRAAGVDIG